MTVTESQTEIDKKNATFWNELCGSHAAQSLGVTDSSSASLKKWDDWFFSFYPYLIPRYLNKDYRKKSLLEVGLGFGSVGQYLGQQQADYSCLDIAAGPVAMMQTRFKQTGLQGTFKQGSMLECPYDDASFDFIVSIGCFHHTGDIRRCLDETHRVLKPGGQALVMVYNRLSFRHWRRWPKTTAASLFGSRKKGSEQERYAYDNNLVGQAAPETDFLTIRELKGMCSSFKSFKARKENFDELTFMKGRIQVPRNVLLSTLGRCMGTDIYIELIK